MGKPHAALLLAAGGSRRLGQPKQLLQRAGETLVHRAGRFALETQPCQLLVVLGAVPDAVRAALRGLECDLIENPAWPEGVGSSLRAAAPALDSATRRVLVLGCDQPALEASHLHALVAGARHASCGCAAVLHDGRPGIPAVVPRSWFDSAAPLDADRGFGPRLRLQMSKPHPACVLDAPELMFDIDTRQDLNVARARGWVDASSAA